MNAIVRSSVLYTLVLGGFSPLGDTRAEPAAGECVKQVFHRYCLGGASLPATAQRIGTEEKGRVRYRIGRDQKPVHITVGNGRIVAVSRQESPGSWLNFTDWKTRLIRLYGRPEDLSSFPAYASSRSSRLNAINAGKGFAHTRWQQTGWSVSLYWDNRDHVRLEYRLSEQAASNDDEGL